MLKIKFDEFMATKKIEHTGYSDDYIEAIQILVKHQDYKNIMDCNYLDGVSYLWKKQITGVNLSSENGKYYCEIVFPRNGDIIDNIQVQSNIKHTVSYYMNNIKCVPDYEFLMVSAIYVEYKIRITFDTHPTINDLTTIIARYYVMDIEHRILLQKSTIITNNYIYNDGLCQHKV